MAKNYCFFQWYIHFKLSLELSCIMWAIIKALQWFPKNRSVTTALNMLFKNKYTYTCVTNYTG